ncbi:MULTISPECIES: carbon-nitrogen hydrolase family protein [Haloferax]|uniref:carbon-nitrogen hydrolase family protein n=1 Tax=Haloferax TaxID=2251 RepID=UPI0006941B94|nr:carbon-nitrogen hydrolase family protein [Haloferax sp. ATB1]
MAFKAAVVQAEPEYLNLEATVEKACNKIREAGEEGADLIAFGESFIPGYPWFIWMGPPSWWLPYQQQLYKNALTLPSDEVDALAAAADDADAHVMIGATVREGDSLYVSQVFLNRDGEFEGVHHKLKPTFLERAVWGDGPGETMQVYDTDIGEIGGLCCWENMMPLSRYTNYELGEQIHVSAFPGFSMQHVGRLFQEEVNITMNRNYAVEGGAFVLMASNVIGESQRDLLCDTEEREEMLGKGGGHSEIIAPNGQVIGGPLEGDTEDIAYAQVNLDHRIPVKGAFDAVGHYTRPDVANVNLDLRPNPPVNHQSGMEANQQGKASDQIAESVESLRDEIRALGSQLNESATATDSEVTVDE